MNTEHCITAIAGVDVSKLRLDVAVHGCAELLQVANTPAGHADLLVWLAQRCVGRVGLEASGGYERGVAGALAAAGLQVVVHQPLEVRLFARLVRQRAKTDRLDARLIASATAHLGRLKAAADPRLGEMAERLTAYEQDADLASVLKTQMEHLSLPELVADARAQLAELLARKRRLAAQMLARLQLWPDLAHRLELLRSLPGVGPIVGLSLLIRMPELGHMSRGQAAALIGVAPFDRQSGQKAGQPCIAGGRRRPRRMTYIAALAAKRCDPTLKAFAARLEGAGKPAKLVLVAVMRKLIEAANIVLKRDQPWVPGLT
jgi:transposase